MDVSYSTFRGQIDTTIENYIESALRPYAYETSGTIESIQTQCNNNSMAIGRLCNILVERGLITLNDVTTIGGRSDTLTKI